MISITEQFVESASPNADATKNGRALVVKGKFTTLNKSADDTLLFGQCQGSGKDPYLCSADFQVAESPVFRCNCPSRQFPCKHSIGLMFAFVQGKQFTVADVPESIASKREKAVARVEKKKSKPKNLESSISRLWRKRLRHNWMALICSKSWRWILCGWELAT